MLPTSTIGETGAKKDWAVVGWGRLKGVKRLGGGKEDGGDRSGGVGGGGGGFLSNEKGRTRSKWTTSAPQNSSSLGWLVLLS